MFYECESGRIQNLTLLQNVISMSKEDGKFCIGWVQSNGAIVQEYEFSTIEEAEAKTEEIKTALLAL